MVEDVGERESVKLLLSATPGAAAALEDGPAVTDTPWL